MRHRRDFRIGIGGLVIAAGLILALESAMAQQGHRHGVPVRRGPVGQVPAAVQARPPMVGPPLLWHPEVQLAVQETDDGVIIMVTSQKPELVDRIRQELPARLEWLRGLRERHEGVGPRRLAGPAQMRRGPAFHPGPGLEGVSIETEVIDGGLAISVTSDDPERAAALKRALPKRIQAMQHFAAGAQALRESRAARAGGMRARALPGLILAKDVALELTETENGIVLKVTSEKPEQAQKIKEAFRDRIEAIERLREAKERGRPAKEGKVRVRQRAKQQPALRGAEPELREIIREEIRRYMEGEEPE